MKTKSTEGNLEEMSYVNLENIATKRIPKYLPILE